MGSTQPLIQNAEWRRLEALRIIARLIAGLVGLYYFVIGLTLLYASI
jgi:hypothetical protein